MNEFSTSLKHGFLTDKNGLKTSFYISKKDNKPLAVLIHGFGGNAYGMSFLGRELARDFRILLLEMPNHGKSDFLSIKKAEDLRNWNREIMEKIEQRFGAISLIVCHSMGCFSPSKDFSERIPTALINPVFQTPSKAILGVKINSISAIGALTNLPIFSPIKALFLIKIWRAQSVKNVFENMIFSFASPLKFARQAKMAQIPLSEPFFSGEYSAVSMIFHGSRDKLTLPLSKQNKAKYFPQTKIISLDTGHLAPIEIPEIIAREIRDNLKTHQ
ncbi:MAG: alpha/beta hydrolase [bacterium]|nr:alpha/beta hydrolase [bacterium]